MQPSKSTSSWRREENILENGEIREEKDIKFEVGIWTEGSFVATTRIIKGADAERQS